MQLVHFPLLIFEIYADEPSPDTRRALCTLPPFVASPSSLKCRSEGGQSSGQKNWSSPSLGWLLQRKQLSMSCLRYLERKMRELPPSLPLFLNDSTVNHAGIFIIISYAGQPGEANASNTKGQTPRKYLVRRLLASRAKYIDFCCS